MSTQHSKNRVSAAATAVSKQRCIHYKYSLSLSSALHIYYCQFHKLHFNFLFAHKIPLEKSNHPCSDPNQETPLITPFQLNQNKQKQDSSSPLFGQHLYKDSRKLFRVRELAFLPPWEICRGGNGSRMAHKICSSRCACRGRTLSWRFQRGMSCSSCFSLLVREGGRMRRHRLLLAPWPA